MSWTAPGFDWEAVRDDAVEGVPAVAVRAELSALGAAERALLQERLAWRCAVRAVRVGRGGRAQVTFVGVTADRLTDAFRAAADASIASVGADVAAGWTAADERERHRPFSWG